MKKFTEIVSTVVVAALIIPMLNGCYKSKELSIYETAVNGYSDLTCEYIRAGLSASQANSRAADQWFNYVKENLNQAQENAFLAESAARIAECQS